MRHWVLGFQGVLVSWERKMLVYRLWSSVVIAVMSREFVLSVPTFLERTLKKLCRHSRCIVSPQGAFSETVMVWWGNCWGRGWLWLVWSVWVVDRVLDWVGGVESILWVVDCHGIDSVALLCNCGLINCQRVGCTLGSMWWGWGHDDNCWWGVRCQVWCWSSWALWGLIMLAPHLMVMGCVELW